MGLFCPRTNGVRREATGGDLGEAIAIGTPPSGGRLFVTVKQEIREIVERFLPLGDESLGRVLVASVSKPDAIARFPRGLPRSVRLTVPQSSELFRSHQAIE